MSSNLYYGYYELWELHHKVTFDGPNKLIIVAPGVTALDVRIDIYSDWKEWVKFENNTKFLPALRSVGGDPVGVSSRMGSAFFLTYGWKIKPPEADTLLSINGTIFVENAETYGEDPFISPDGNYSISIRSATSEVLLVTQEVPTATEIADEVVAGVPASPTPIEIATEVDNILDIPTVVEIATEVDNTLDIPTPPSETVIADEVWGHAIAITLIDRVMELWQRMWPKKRTLTKVSESLFTEDVYDETGTTVEATFNHTKVGDVETTERQ